MLAVPSGRYRYLSNRAVSTALNIRCLQPNLANGPICQRCAHPNVLNHYEACHNRRFPSQSRHDAVLAKIIETVRKERWITREPLVAQPPNSRRADVEIGTDAVGFARDPLFGLIDLKIKAVLAQDTNGARTNAPEGGTLTRNVYNQIQAALDVADATCRASYAPLNLPQPVTPIVMSSGGTLHPTCYEFLKATVPDTERRRQLRISISLSLVRARAQVYDLARE